MGKKFSRHPKLKRVGKNWRRQKGRFNKMKKELKGKGKIVKIGYGSPKNEKFVHPSGKIEVMISNPKELNKVDPEKECVRIRGNVGKKKRNEITKKAKELKIKVL